jgi:hypothetical protein
MLDSVFKYDTHASCITLYPLACIQKGIDLVDVIPRTCTGLTIRFIIDTGTLNASKFLKPLTSFEYLKQSSQIVGQ